MQVTPFLRNEAFQPEHITAMSEALTHACRSLGLADRSDPITEIVARHIIEAAQRGIYDETALYLSAMKEFKSNPQ